MNGISDGTTTPVQDATTHLRVTEADLEWWLGLAARVDWSWARTYAESAPHSYVVLGRTAGMGADDYVRAGRVIHTFGRPAKFYGMTSIYLTSPDGRLKWWTMAADVTETTLINQATTERLYGVQNAPVTESGIPTAYDALATAYDALYPTSDEMAEQLRAAVTTLSGDYTPSILDAGCGTGRVLDLGLTTPDRYAGVDPSKPMLNQRVRKHPGVAAVYPMTVEQAFTDRLFTSGQFDIATMLLAASDHVQEWAIEQVRRIASRGLVLGREGGISYVDTGDPHGAGRA